MKAKNLRAGMKVVVKAHNSGDNSKYSSTKGFYNYWSEELMDGSVGSEFYVDYWSYCGVILAFDEDLKNKHLCAFPPKCLKIVKD